MEHLPQINVTLQEACAYTDGDRLIVTTGRVRRVWQWIGTGFATVEAAQMEAGLVWAGETARCDWQLPGGAEPGPADLLTLSAPVGNDAGFTSDHVGVEAEIDYPDAGMVLRLTIWAYPGACGLRTQLAARRTETSQPRSPSGKQGSPAPARVDRLPLPKPAARRRFFGYYNDTQNRNDTHQAILKEEVIDHPLQGREWCDWASVACAEDDAGGMALVKESHKCVNQRGYETGGFIVDRAVGLACTGWGLRPAELSSDAFTSGWATWWIMWSGGDLDRELAFKIFDQVRYPIDPDRDIYIQANTWGSTDNSQDAHAAASESNVLAELDACASLGIDSLQIDDGWQTPAGHRGWDPGQRGWHPHPERYPQGWTNVRARAAELGVKLGLWAAAQPISLKELQATHTEGGFAQYKLDFAVLRSRAEIDALMQKVRDFIAWTGHKVRVNWDVTENSPRYGYFFAREYGCIYLENRKAARPLSVVYRPHTVLRDLWQVARYLNLHRFQCSVQNVDRVDPAWSDAPLHPHAYVTAIALMGIPLFFQETKYYTAAARAEIRPLLDVYKQHREAIYRGIVHPIGNMPDNASWTGFQCHLADEKRGYLTIFRERCSMQPEQIIHLDWLPEGMLRLTDLVRGTTREVHVGPDGAVTFRLDQAPDFLFLHYDAA